MRSINPQTCKIVFLVALLSIVPYMSHAAVPQKINYQGALTDSGGTAINTTVSILFAIYDVSTGGTALWSETQSVIVSNGVFSVDLGDVTPIDLPFDTQYYLGINVAGDGEMTPRKSLTTTGYAFRADGKESYTAGESVTRDDLLCFDTDAADSKVYKCDTDDSTRFTIFAGIATANASADAPVIVQNSGKYTANGIPWTANGAVFISGSAGSPGTSMASIFVGWAESTKIITIAPQTSSTTLASSSHCGTVQDSYGNTYNTVTIGSQCWMKENLNVGTMINSTTGGTNSDGESTDNSTLEKYCYNDVSTNCDVLGGLYQWDEMMQYVTTEGVQGICPSGWHIPTDTEWFTMENSVDSTITDASATGNWGAFAGMRLQEGGSSGFDALLAGNRYTNGSFYGSGSYGYFWSSTESGAVAWGRRLNSGDASVNRNADVKALGYSVRCLKD